MAAEEALSNTLLYKVAVLFVNMKKRGRPTRPSDIYESFADYARSFVVKHFGEDAAKLRTLIAEDNTMDAFRAENPQTAALVERFADDQEKNWDNTAGLMKRRKRTIE